MISIKDLHAWYGPVEALKGLDIDIRKGKITCLIGNNGAGKTTLINSISGMVKNSGSILFDGTKQLVGMSPYKITRLGIAHVPEGRHVFPGLTVYDNLITGTITWHGFLGKQSYEDDLEEVFTLFPRLKERRNQMAWSLSGGEQQMLAIGRALMARPKVLLLDEPSMGLSPVLTAEVFEKIQEINKNGMTVLLIEQNAKQAMKISDYTYVIVRGTNGIFGESALLQNDPQIVNAYLGKFHEKDTTI